MSEEIRLYNEVVLQTLEIGDLVEFPRGIYSHWVVYIGGCEIVHLSGIDRSGTATDSPSSNVINISGIGYTNACVKRENFWNVARESKAKKNNCKDRNNWLLSRAEIKERALSKLGPIYYSVLLNNCEHFAVWCRYGREESQQVDRVLTGAVAIGGVAVIGGLAYQAYTGGIDVKSEPTSYNATDFAVGRNVIPVLPQANGLMARAHTSWFSVGLSILFDVGKLCYDAYTGGNDRRDNCAYGMDPHLDAFIREYSTSNIRRWNDFRDGTGIGIHSSGRFCFDMGC